jgi:hypothetical protein
MISFAAFRNEMEKISSNWHDVAEVGGLGILAAPHVKSLVTGKKTDHKTERNAELTGLGVLAAPAAHNIYKRLAKR